MNIKNQSKVIYLTSYLATNKKEKDKNTDKKREKIVSKKINTQRRQLIAKVKIAQKELGINETDYRVLLDVNFGVSSCTQLDDQGLVRLVTFLRSKGWKGRPAHVLDHHGRPATLVHGGSHPTAPVMRKIEALLSELGKVKGEYVPWDYAASILKRQTGCDCLDAMDVKSLCDVVAALNYTLKSARRKAECKTK